MNYVIGGILLIVGTAIAYYYYMRVNVYRFIRSNCPECDASQEEWDKFKKMTRFKLLNPVEINLDTATDKEKEIAGKFRISNYLPDIFMYDGNGEGVGLEGRNPSAEIIFEWANGMVSR